VQAYIAAMPGWKRAVGAALDALIVREVPQVKKAVRWNTAFYGVEGRGWIVAAHVFERYLKVTFFAGSALQPPPPVASKVEGTRYLHLQEGDAVETPQIASWVRQAAAIDGWHG
jgi:hypothetical protein